VKRDWASLSFRGGGISGGISTLSFRNVATSLGAFPTEEAATSGSLSCDGSSIWAGGRVVQPQQQATRMKLVIIGIVHECATSLSMVPANGMSDPPQAIRRSRTLTPGRVDILRLALRTY
jgi:hypothetical protein